MQPSGIMLVISFYVFIVDLFYEVGWGSYASQETETKTIDEHFFAHLIRWNNGSKKFFHFHGNSNNSLETMYVSHIPNDSDDISTEIPKNFQTTHSSYASNFFD